MKKLTKEEKTKHEISVISKMIDIFYKNHQGDYSLLEINDLKNYCINRVTSCPLIESKTFCSSCKIHCYDDKHRNLIKKVMKFSGPRMIFYHPLLTIKHFFYG